MAETELPPMMTSQGGVVFNHEHIAHWKARALTAELALARRPSPKTGEVSDEAVEAATRAFRGSTYDALTLDECRDAVRAAFAAAIPFLTPVVGEGEAEPFNTGVGWENLTCDDQFALAERIAANVGYVLVPEPEINSVTHPVAAEAVIEAFTHAFITCVSDGQARDYRIEAKFRDLKSAQTAHSALVKAIEALALSSQGEHQ
jgi:hypothetical protein